MVFIMDLEQIFMLMVISMKVNILMIKEMEMEHFISKMVISIKVNGKMIMNTVKASIHFRMEMYI